MCFVLQKNCIEVCSLGGVVKCCLHIFALLSASEDIFVSRESLFSPCSHRRLSSVSVLPQGVWLVMPSHFSVTPGGIPTPCHILPRERSEPSESRTCVKTTKLRSPGPLSTMLCYVVQPACLASVSRFTYAPLQPGGSRGTWPAGTEKVALINSYIFLN